MDKYEELDQLLNQALSSTAEPSEALNQEIRYRIKESKTMKPARKKYQLPLLLPLSLLCQGRICYGSF